MKFADYVKKYKAKINEAIKSIYDKKLTYIDNSFLKDYYSELREYFLTGGKRIRPLLSIVVYNAFIDNPDEKIIFPSVGIEFLHNASLIHDDIIDKDNFRRGQPAFHFRFQNYHQKFNLKKMNALDYGTSIGIIGGDSAFFLGLEAYLFNEFEQDLNLKAIQYYEQAFIEVANGVLIETDMVNRKNLTISDYINMVSLKTGALIEKSLLIGANYAKINEKSLSDLSTYGKNLGIIFQITDDILGTFGDEKITGKPTDGDIREGKKTCLLIEAFNKLENDDRKNLDKIINKSSMTQNDVQEVKNLFIKADVINSCKKLANTYYLEAKNALNKLSSRIKQSELEFFEDLLTFVIERNY